MRQVGIDTPSYGFLADYFAVPDGGKLAMRSLIHPRAEPEFAFILKEGLKGPDCHAGAVLAATDFVMPALEIIDSRYENFKFDLPSVVADNSSSARFVLGGRCRAPTNIDLATTGVVMEKNGQPVAFGAGAAVLGHPAAAVALVVNLMARQSEELPAGSLILTGRHNRGCAGRAGRLRSIACSGSRLSLGALRMTHPGEPEMEGCRTETAIVSGAAGAIGCVIAKRLAARGLDVLAVGRNLASLKQLADNLEGVRPVSR